MTVCKAESFSEVCGGIYRKTSDYMSQLIRTLSKNKDFYLTEEMDSSSASSELSASSLTNISTYSRSSSCSLKESDESTSSPDIFQKPWQRKRSTSLIEWKKAPAVKATEIVDDTGKVNVIPGEFFHLNHAASTYLDQYTPREDIRDNPLSNVFFTDPSSGQLQLPSSRSTPDMSRSATISRTNSMRTNCSCFSCTYTQGIQRCK